MAVQTVKEIEEAISQLAPQQLEALYSWLDRHHPVPLDARIEKDLAAGHLDKAITLALADESSGRTRSL